MTTTQRGAVISAVTSVVFCGAIFGFFYAWVCSTLWGLDATQPHIAIEAMQAMNASVRNAVFFPAFFLTPAVCAVAALLAARAGARRSAWWFGGAAAVYLLGGVVITAAINVPMNEALALVDADALGADAATVWSDYSRRWQFWNAVRALASAVALVLAGSGTLVLGFSLGGRGGPRDGR